MAVHGGVDNPKTLIQKGKISKIVIYFIAWTSRFYKPSQLFCLLNQFNLALCLQAVSPQNRANVSQRDI